MKKDSKKTSVIEVMADLCGIPRKELAKEVKERMDNTHSHTLWAIKDPINDAYLFRGQGGGCFLGSIVSLILGNELVFAHTKKAIEEKYIVESFKKEYRLKLKPVRITVEINEV